nr:hypothetical protein [Tanacetum cinerariifolium]
MAKAIKEYEKSRGNLDSAEISGGNTRNAGGTVNVQEKVEQVFEICKCAEEDKVMFAASTFEGRALTWWNGNVHTLGLVNANRDDIEAYNNRFYELVLMCPELVSTEKKKIKKYIHGFPERIKGNITSSKPATLHDAINMARELVEQAVQGRAARIGESNNRKWEDHQRNTNNNSPNNNNRNQNNNHHQQQNRRQETARANVAALDEGRGYAGNLPRRKIVELCFQNLNVVTGTFLLNDHYACILFDSGAEKSFVSSAFTPFIDISPACNDPLCKEDRYIIIMASHQSIFKKA